MHKFFDSLSLNLVMVESNIFPLQSGFFFSSLNCPLYFIFLGSSFLTESTGGHALGRTTDIPTRLAPRETFVICCQPHKINIVKKV